MERKQNEFIAVACKFLMFMECAIEHELPVPVVMRRINDLLTEKLKPAESTQESYSSSSGSYNHQNRQQQSSSNRIGESQKVIGEFRKAIRTMESTKEPICVDIQCLNTNKGYAIKEFVAQCAGATAWIMVKSPSGVVAIKPDNDHLLKSVHGIDWDSGVIDEQQLRNFTSYLFKSGRPVIVKGQQKAEILARKLNIPESSIKSMDDYPRLSKLREMFPSPACPFHRHLDRSFQCALKHTHAIVSYKEYDWS